MEDIVHLVDNRLELVAELAQVSGGLSACGGGVSPQEGPLSPSRWKTMGRGASYKQVVAFTTQDKVRSEVKSIFGSGEDGTYFRIGKQVSIRCATNNPT